MQPWVASEPPACHCSQSILMTWLLGTCLRAGLKSRQSALPAVQAHWPECQAACALHACSPVEAPCLRPRPGQAGPQSLAAACLRPRPARLHMLAPSGHLVSGAVVSVQPPASAVDQHTCCTRLAQGQLWGESPSWVHSAVGTSGRHPPSSLHPQSQALQLHTLASPSLTGSGTKTSALSVCVQAS